jgi:hypothetical protein
MTDEARLDIDGAALSLFTEPQNPWARISEIAGRLGVRPVQQGQTTILVTGADGEAYDVWEVVSAFLDRMELVARLDRVDAALAGQLSRSMTENARLKIELAKAGKPT